ncbi:MAG: class I SAM-dependent methyltransferase [Anaerolineales bacterium]|nr:class I SAM-dependent methyltransferase [Anaerolineales bacterium]
MIESIDAYYRHGPHLALYKAIPGLQDFWEDLWLSSSIPEVLKRAGAGMLGEFEFPFTAYLPKNGLILEAGCGSGRYVKALQARGYTIEGIDYAAETIKRIQEVDPDLQVREGNILAIDRPDNTYAAYISIGVLEHNFEGPESGVQEAHRVLKPGGVALVSVPYLNWARRRVRDKASSAASETLPGGLRFYQDHIDIEHFTALFEATGFRVLNCYPYLLFGGLIRDWRLGRWLNRNSFFSWRARQLFKRMCESAPTPIRNELSHMMMVIAEKK